MTYLPKWLRRLHGLCSHARRARRQRDDSLTRFAATSARQIQEAQSENALEGEIAQAAIARRADGSMKLRSVLTQVIDRQKEMDIRR